MPTPELLTFIEEVNKRLEHIKPIWGPIAERPRPWTGLNEGGFYRLNKPFVKTRSKLHRTLLETHPMPEVYEAINGLQETPYCINEPVLDVVLALWERGLKIVGLPERYDESIHGPPADWKKEDCQKRKERMDRMQHDASTHGVPADWEKESFRKHKEGMEMMTKHFECARTLGVAQTYRREERFYFVHTLDFRGRTYPVTSYLSPQGKDLDRGLLTFAQECAEPLGKSGALWLAIHGANGWGLDKASFEERIAWVEENTPRILRIAEEPLSDYWWTEAGEPFQFLAFCFEWAEYQKYGIEYRCSLPVAVDGSSNALQHFSALLLDKSLGEATNMLPVETPRDLYREVCDVVSETIERDAKTGKQEALALLGNVTRKVVKTPVMTAYYGVTDDGMREQIKKAFEEQKVRIEEGRREAISYLIDILDKVIPEKAPAVAPCMELLKEVTRILAKNNLPTIWTTPSGFLVVQEYRDSPGSMVRTKLFGKTHCINYQRGDLEAKINVREHTSGISANFIHSLDSAAMVLCVLEAKTQGVKVFRMIHDGFSTVPAHMELLNTAIRKSFKEMYEKENLLQKFVMETLEKNVLQNESLEALEETTEVGGTTEKEQKKAKERAEKKRRKQQEKEAKKREEESWENVWAKFNIQPGELDLDLLMRALYFFA